MTAQAPSALLPHSAIDRRTMVDCQIRTFDVTDQAVIARFLDVPREMFLPPPLRSLAYSDEAIDIRTDKAQCTRQLLPPLILAKMMQAAAIKPSDKVLDVASGAGYSTVLLAGLAKKVTALESDAAFTALIEDNLRAIAEPRAFIATGPLAQGLMKDAPYDVIFINGAVEAGLEALFAQLSEGGRLIAIQRFEGDPTGRASKAVRFDKIAGEISSRSLFDASSALLSEFKRAPHFSF